MITPQGKKRNVSSTHNKNYSFIHPYLIGLSPTLIVAYMYIPA